MPGPLSSAYTVTELPAQDIERARAFCRDKLGLEPDNYPSKGNGELGTFFYDSEGNLIGIAQPLRDGARRE